MSGRTDVPASFGAGLAAGAVVEPPSLAPLVAVRAAVDHRFGREAARRDRRGRSAQRAAAHQKHVSLVSGGAA
jgi:hypothetical protein